MNNPLSESTEFDFETISEMINHHCIKFFNSPIGLNLNTPLVFIKFSRYSSINSQIQTAFKRSSILTIGDLLKKCDINSGELMPEKIIGIGETLCRHVNGFITKYKELTTNSEKKSEDKNPNIVQSPIQIVKEKEALAKLKNLFDLIFDELQNIEIDNSDPILFLKTDDDIMLLEEKYQKVYFGYNTILPLIKTCKTVFSYIVSRSAELNQQNNVPENIKVDPTDPQLE